MVFKNGEKVFGKLRGYAPWPAKICEEKNNNEYLVTFYPKGNIATLKAQDVYHYYTYLPKIKKIKKTKSFDSALIAFFNDMTYMELNKVISIDCSKKFLNYYAHLISEKSQSARINAGEMTDTNPPTTNTNEQENVETHLNRNDTSNLLPSISNNDSTVSIRNYDCRQGLGNDGYDYFMKLFKRIDDNRPGSERFADILEAYSELTAISYYLKSSLLENQIPNVQRCLSALEILKHIKLTKPILITFPAIIEDVAKIRHYHVNLEEYPEHMRIELKKKAKAIRAKAAEVIVRFHQIRWEDEEEGEEEDRHDDGYVSENQL